MIGTTKEFGKITFDQLVHLIDLVNSLPNEKALLIEAYNKNPGKLRSIMNDQFAWGFLYEATLVEQIVLFSMISGLDQTLIEIANSDDPTRAVLSGALEGSPLEGLTPFLTDEEGQQKLIFILLMALNKSVESIRLYGLTIPDLVLKVKQGNDNDVALFKVLRLDRSAVCCPSIANRIARAEFEDDQAFFKKMQNALSGPPKKPRDEYGILRYILYLLHEDGVLDQLSLEDRYSLFCERLKFYPADGEDPAKSLDQFIRRWKKEFST